MCYLFVQCWKKTKEKYVFVCFIGAISANGSSNVILNL